MIIDTHAHVRHLDRLHRIRLLERCPEMRRDFRIDELRRLARGAGVDRIMLVSAAQETAESRFLLDLARRNGDLVVGVIGWVDLEGASLERDLDELGRFPSFAGVRLPLPAMDDDDWILRPAVQTGLKRLAESGVPVNILAFPEHLARCRVVLGRFPDLRVAIDHGGNPDIAADRFESWADEIRDIAETTGAVCKLSGFHERAGPSPGPGTIRRYFDHLVDAFGADRLMVGSNWPAINLASDYATWMKDLGTLLDGRAASKAERHSIRGDTAIRHYGLVAD